MAKPFYLIRHLGPATCSEKQRGNVRNRDGVRERDHTRDLKKAGLFLLGAVLSVTTSAQTTVPRAAIIRYDALHHAEVARDGMVVSQNRIASEVGAETLRQGGNAADAAVATAFALAVTLPRAGNLGGSGYALHYDSNQSVTAAYDFRSTAPAGATEMQFTNPQGDIDWPALTFGARAAAVPGTVAGLWQLWREHGSLPWAALIAPAVELAEKGIVVSYDLAYALDAAMMTFRAFPTSLAVYATPEGASYALGDRLRQPDLAWTLRALQQGGVDAFYRGAIAEKILSAMAEHGGHISRDDLANYRVQHRDPISTQYRDRTVVTMPPSSAGGPALLQMLNILSQFDLSAIPAGSADSLHLLAEVMKRTNAQRRLGIGGLGDPDYVDAPTDAFIDPRVAQLLASDIDRKRATPVALIASQDPRRMIALEADQTSGEARATAGEDAVLESRDTTHLSVVDAQGNAVSLTYTLGYSFGSGFVVEGTGMLLDNQMRNFTFGNPEHANRVAPGKRMLSTMTPTLVFDASGSLQVVTGTPGGSRIHTSILQLLVNMIDYGMSVAEATHHPRIYQAWRQPKLGLERGFSEDTQRALAALGHQLDLQQTMASTQSIELRDGLLFGAADPRRPDAAAIGVTQPTALP
jgi:gamma-glutamyltranspeptidase/glutathione hydrolase